MGDRETEREREPERTERDSQIILHIIHNRSDGQRGLVGKSFPI